MAQKNEVRVAAEEVIRLGHGSGGRLSAEFIETIIKPRFQGLGELDDAAIIKARNARLAFTTDSFVVDPVVFPGGDIGRLAVFGTVNDLSVQGAHPKWLSLSVVAAEGFSLTLFEQIIESVARAVKEVGVSVVTGDTKVMQRGALDGLLLNTAGIGLVADGAQISAARIEAGDRIFVSGDIGSHEMAVMCHRHDLGIENLLSDCGPIDKTASALVNELGGRVKWMRDPTRGGFATVLNELAFAVNAVININEGAIPVNPLVSDAAQILGLDPLYLACEGRFVAVVEKRAGNRAKKILRQYDDSASEVGAIVKTNSIPQVQLNTIYGSRRILRYLAADQQPRIC